MPSLLRLASRVLLTLTIVACAADAPAPPAAVAPSPNVASPLPLAAAPRAVPPAASEDRAAVPITSSDPTWGSRSAPITLVLFADFQCPFCSKLEHTLTELKAAYGPARLRIVWKHNPLPFHQNAKPAAEASIGVFELGGSDAFWQFHDRAFENQSTLSEDSYASWATGLGVDPARIREGLQEHRWAEKVEADMATAKRIGVTSAPASFINGIFISGAQTFDKLKEVIDAELIKAVQLADSGMPADRVYVARAEANFTGKAQATSAPEKKEDTTTVYKVPVGTSPVRGSPTALVTIVEFGDYQCPFCKRVEPALEQIRTTYGADVRLVWKDQMLPFHPRAEPAMELAREARAEKGDAAFWKVHEALFASQPKLEDSDLELLAAAAGIDVAKMHRAMDNHTYRTKALDDENLADDFQASGTPHFFVNGRRLVGAQPFEKFKTIIDEEIEHARGLLASGTPRAGLYERIIRDGKPRPPLETKTLAANPHAPSRGSASAPVVIQEVADFQCPFCRRAEDTLKEVEKQYGAKVRIVWRNLPLPMHADAPLAAQAALEAFHQQGAPAFWKMHDLLFANQTQADHPDGLKRPALDEYAAQLGLDPTRWNAALDGQAHRAAVEADAKAANDAGINGTPGFVINGYYVSGAQPLSRFQRVIEEVLAHGPAKIPPAGHAGGTSVTADGLTIADTVVGTGPAVKSGDRVSVHYTGTLTNGTVFDTSRTRNAPFDFEVGKGSVIKGWDEGLLGMRVGGKRKLTIPPALGYGSHGAGNVIPADATLVFDIELLSIR